MHRVRCSKIEMCRLLGWFVDRGDGGMMEIEDLLSGSWPPTRGVLEQLLEEACVDAYA